MKSTWKVFKDDTWRGQPKERRCVLLAIADGPNGQAAGTMVGYLRYASGDKSCPYFVIPGAREGFKVTHWADCLGDDFYSVAWPTWGEPNKKRGII